MQTGLREKEAALPSLHGDDRQIAVDVKVLVEHQGQFGHRHTVAHGDLEWADKRTPLRFEAIAFDQVAADGIGPVQNHHFFAILPGGLHAIDHGGREGVDAGACILDIDEQPVDRVEHGPGGLARLAVKTE